MRVLDRFARILSFPVLLLARALDGGRIAVGAVYSGGRGGGTTVSVAIVCVKVYE